jgi:hypothetical protein
LIETGAIGTLKRDVLLEASEDFYYICHIQKWFEEEAGASAAKEATACTVRVAEELIVRSFCGLATWGPEGVHQRVERSSDELTMILQSHSSRDSNLFDFFLVTTEKGNQWVKRHKRVINEL